MYFTRHFLYIGNSSPPSRSANPRAYSFSSVFSFSRWRIELPFHRLSAFHEVFSAYCCKFFFHFFFLLTESTSKSPYLISINEKLFLFIFSNYAYFRVVKFSVVIKLIFNFVRFTFSLRIRSWIEKESARATFIKNRSIRWHSN